MALLAALAAAVALAPATVTLSTHAHGAADVRASVTFTTLLQCGQPQGGVAVTWPGAVPPSIATSAVLLDKQPVAVASVAGHTVTVKAARGEVTCDSLVVGPATVTFAATAGLANPRVAGTYTVTVRNNGRIAAARVRIR